MWHYIWLVLAAAARASFYTPPRFRTDTQPDVAKGTRCYNCLSLDQPACWNPDHPDNAQANVPNIDCYIPDMEFVCIVITAESATLVESGEETGPVRARTCVPAKEFPLAHVPWVQCARLSRELAASEIFPRVSVRRPQCALCRRPLCC